MNLRLLKPSVLTPEERLKQDLESRVKTTYYDSGRQSDRFCMEQALNYIIRLETQLNEILTPRTRTEERPMKELIMLKPEIKTCLQDRIDKPYGQFDYESNVEYYVGEWLLKAALSHIKRIESDLDSLRARYHDTRTKETH